MRVKLKTLQVQFTHLSERKNTARLFIRVGEVTEKSFRKMELLEFGEDEKNTAAIDNDDDDNFDNTDLFCVEDDKEEYDLCSGCGENLIAHIVQPCGHMICTNCVKKNNWQFGPL